MQVCACVTEALLFDRFLVRPVWEAYHQWAAAVLVTFSILTAAKGLLMSFQATELLHRLVQHTQTGGMQLPDLLV